MQAQITNRLVSGLQPSDKIFDVWDASLPGFVIRVRPSGRLTYLFSFRRPNGRRTCRKLGCHPAVSAAQARDSAMVIAGELAKGVDPTSSKNRIELGAFVDGTFREWARANLRDGDESANRILRRFPALLGHQLQALSVWSVERWMAEKRNTGLKASAINRDVAGLKAAVARAEKWGLIRENPLKRVTLLKTDKLSQARMLDQKEETRLRKALDEREEQMRVRRVSANSWRAARGYACLPSLDPNRPVDRLKTAVVLSMNTGLRRGELLSLRVEDVDLRKCVLTVKGPKAKNGQTRHIPLNREAAEVIAKWLSRLESPGPNDLIFPGSDGRPVIDIKRAWKAVLCRAGIIGFRWHDLRHHFASRLAIEGADLNSIRELLGHSDTKMTIRYAHLCPSSKAKAVSLLDGRPPLDRIEHVAG